MDDVFYKRELNHNYMVLKSESRDLAARYEYRMMTENRIGKLLSCSQRQLDGEIWLYYDISSLQPVKRLYESKKLDIHELGRIVHAIADIQEDLSEYLMDEQGLMLDTDMLFTDIETEELYFCYDPGHHGPENRYAKLADFFLENVDHGQEPAVNAAYQFYKMSKSEYFVLSSFLPFLEKEQLRTTSNMEPTGWTNRISSWDRISPAPTAPRKPQEEAVPAKEGGQKKHWSFPFFSLKKTAKKKKIETLPAANQNQKEWSRQVWDSYVEQIDLIGNGETVYFADLDRSSKNPHGIPCLRDEETDRLFPLEHLPITVGKLKGKAGILLTDSSVSRLHARFESSENGVCIRDLNSRNGTLVNGRKLSPNEIEEIKEGDLLQFGRERFRYGFLDSNLIK